MMPAYLAYPWLYRQVTHDAPEGSDARLKIDALLGLGDAAEVLKRRQVEMVKAAGFEVG